MKKIILSIITASFLLTSSTNICAKKPKAPINPHYVYANLIVDAIELGAAILTFKGVPQKTAQTFVKEAWVTIGIVNEQSNATTLDQLEALGRLIWDKINKSATSDRVLGAISRAATSFESDDVKQKLNLLSLLTRGALATASWITVRSMLLGSIRDLKRLPITTS